MRSWIPVFLFMGVSCLHGQAALDELIRKTTVELPRLSQTIATYDANGDGIVTCDEFVTQRINWYKVNVLLIAANMEPTDARSRADMTSYRDQLRELFAKQDIQGDGVLSRDDDFDGDDALTYKDKRLAFRKGILVYDDAKHPQNLIPRAGTR